MRIIYSNCLGSYLFDNGRIVDKIKFNGEKEAIEKSLLLEKGEIIDEEKQLLKKHKDAVFANRKKGSVNQLEDKKEIRKILDCFRSSINEYSVPLTLLAKRKVMESVKFDLLVIQSVNSTDELGKASNLIAKRLREWYELYNPEFSKFVQDHQKFAEATLKSSKEELLKQMSISKEFSMGADIKKSDLDVILLLSSELERIFELEKKQKEYIEKMMNENCRNISAVAGPLLGAKLIALAGSLERLAILPASTVQLLGAEKALFRHIKTGARSPKHGVILQHPLVAAAKRKGRAARAFANTISIAAKVDYFKGNFVGDELLKKLKEKLKGG